MAEKEVEKEKEEAEKEYESDDGWDEEYFEDLISAQDELDNLGYEIRHCQRNRSLSDISEELMSIVGKLQGMQRQVEKDWEEDYDEEDDE